ncbi:LOW QUALITY PROTEIN: hypothetical protein HJFPF1_12677 [Paramyrothecium foliicola]|nr:LOW QUALITY PROTEIN: hypothetical protein HJFPF1_12677 [Paramyrothecium foliicola]
MFMPYLHWELDHQRERLQAFVGQRWAHHKENLQVIEYERYLQRRKERADLSGPKRPARPATHREGKSTLSRRTWNTARRSTHDTALSDHRPPNDPPEAVARRVQREPSGRFRHITPQWPRRDTSGRLLTANKLGQLLYDAFKLFEAVDNYRDRRLIDSYLLGEPPLHPRRTLDQAHFWTLRNTKTRDRDQVVYRGTSAKPDMRHHYNPEAKAGQEWSCDKEEDIRRTQFDLDKQGAEQSRGVLMRLSSRQGWTSMAESALAAVERAPTQGPGLPFVEPHDCPSVSNDADARPPYVECQTCREAIRKVPRLLMVDQLWMWILDDHTIITCFPKRYGLNRQDASGVHKAIRQRLSQIRRNHIRSAYDLALIIIDESSSLFFDRTKTDERQPQVMEIFSEAIGNMAHKQTISSNHLWHWADELARASSTQASRVDLSALHIALLNITPEGKLQRETKDIIEELDILIHTTRRQRELLKRFKKHGENLLDRNGTFKSGHWDGKPEHMDARSLASLQSLRDGEDQEQYEKWKWFRTNAEEIILEVEDHLEELLGLHSSADAVCKSLDNLLALKQQQASVVVAWQSIRHGEEAVKQGRAIMIFTIITIIFLPLAFMAAIFGMNNNTLGDDKMSLGQQLKLMFSISVGVIAVVVVIAFSNFIRAFTWSVLHYTVNWLLVKTGLYRLWLDVADKLREEHLVGWAEKEVGKMKEAIKKDRRRQMALQFDAGRQLGNIISEGPNHANHDHHGLQNGSANGRLNLRRVLLGALDLDQQLAGVDALVQVHQALLGGLDAALEDGLGGLDLALGDPLGDLLAGLGELVGVVHDDEALHADAHGDEARDVAGADGLGGVVLADHAAADEAGVLLGLGKAHVENISADLDINVVLGGGVELVLEVGGLVVEGNIEAEVVDQPLALVVAAGDGNDAGAVDVLGDLGGDGAGGAGGTGHDDGLTGLDAAADDGDADPGGHAGHAQTGQHVLGAADAGVVGGGLEGALAEDGVVGPAAVADDQVVLGGLLAAGGEDAADASTAHDGADLDGRDVGTAVCTRSRCKESKAARMGHNGGEGSRTVQPAAHGGVKRQVENLDEDLAILEVAGRGDGSCAGLEGLAGDDVVGRPFGEVEGGSLERHDNRMVL